MSLREGTSDSNAERLRDFSQNVMYFKSSSLVSMRVFDSLAIVFFIITLLSMSSDSRSDLSRNTFRLQLMCEGLRCCCCCCCLADKCRYARTLRVSFRKAANCFVYFEPSPQLRRSSPLTCSHTTTFSTSSTNPWNI